MTETKPNDLYKNWIQVTEPLKDKSRVYFWRKILHKKGFQTYWEYNEEGYPIVFRKKTEDDFPEQV